MTVERGGHEFKPQEGCEAYSEAEIGKRLVYASVLGLEVLSIWRPALLSNAGALRTENSFVPQDKNRPSVKTAGLKPGVSWPPLPWEQRWDGESSLWEKAGPWALSARGNSAGAEPVRLRGGEPLAGFKVI